MEILKKLARQLPALIGVALLIGAIYVVQKEFRSLKMEDISHALGAIPVLALVFSFFWTFMSYYVLTFYDLLGTIYAGHRVAYGRVCFASFCAYTLSHNLGFAAVSGAAVRYRLYSHWGLTPMQIAKLVAFCSLTFALGGLVLGGVVLFLEPDAVPFFGERLPRWSMYLIGAALWVVVIGYVTLARVLGTFSLFGHSIGLPGLRLALLQVVLATIDVLMTATIFFALLPHADGLTLLRFLAVYLTAYTAGLAANLPGGIGVFDTAMLLGLSPWLEPPTIVGAIVVFRLFYYIIPLFIAGIMFTGNELLVRGGSMLKGVRTLAGWSEPDFPIAVATGAVALSGAMLMSVGVLSPPPEFTWIDTDLQRIAGRAGQLLPSLIGAGLLVLAAGLSRRVHLAWSATLGLLLVGAAFSFAQGQRLWVGSVLLLVMALIAPFHRAFYRHARLLSGPLQVSTAVPLLTLAVCVLAIAGFARQARFMHGFTWWEIVLSPDMPVSLRVTVALAVALGLFAIWSLIRPGRVPMQAWDEAARARLLALGGTAPVLADGLVWGENGTAALAFRRHGRILLGLGDPVGDPHDRASTVWQLRDLAVKESRSPAFWQAGPDLLGVYADLGLTALPLGPDGKPLPEARGDTPRADTYLVCAAERDLNTLLALLPELSQETDS
jgi:uncharacterized membrane protein YbhN (UPF0104 family)